MDGMMQQSLDTRANSLNAYMQVLSAAGSTPNYTTVGISTSMVSDFHYTGNASNGMLGHMTVFIFLLHSLSS